jgi:hypothetical protein
MTTTFSLFVASCLLAAPGDPLPAASSCGCGMAGPTCATRRCPRPADRLGVLFRRQHNYCLCCQRATYYPLATPVVRTAPQPMMTPAQPPAPTTLPVAANETQVTALRPNLDQPKLQVAKKYEDMIGHEKDYTWVTGHLFYVHSDGGRWVVRYAMPGEIDKFGGSVVLAPGVEMRNFREGDLVCIHGDVLSEGRATPSLGGALYRVNAIAMVDRSDP